MKAKLRLILILFSCVAGVLAQAPPWYWAQQGATSGNEWVGDVCADPLSQGLYAGGTFDGNLTPVYGSSLSAALGPSDVVVLKYDAAGNVLWAFKIGNQGTEVFSGIAADPAGDIYVIGTFNGTCDFDPSPTQTFTLSSSGTDGFLAKYNANGGFLWALKLGSSGTDDIRGIYADANGVYITGYFTGIASFNTTSGTPALLSASGDEDSFAAKYNASGVRQWVVKQAGTKTDIGYEISADASNVYFIGTYDKDISLYNATGVNPTATLVSQQVTKSSVFVSAYTQAGALVWATNISSTDNNLGLGLAFDNTNLYITGSIANTASFPYPSALFTQTAQNNSDVFLACLSKSAGIYQWVSQQAGSSNGNAVGFDLEVVNNRIVVSGNFTGQLSYQSWGGPQLNANGFDPFITGFDLSGNYIWTSAYGGNSNDLPYGLAVNTTGAIFVGGSYGSGITFGNISLANANGSNMFVAKLGCDSILVNLPSPLSQTICPGTAGSVITASISAGTNYSIQWEQSVDGQTWTTAGATATNSSFAPPVQTATRWYRSVVNAMSGCSNFSASAAALVDIEVQPTANAGSDQIVCVSAPTVTMTALSPTIGTAVWSLLVGSGTPGNPAQATTVVSGLSPGLNGFVWTASSGTCTGNSDTVYVIVQLQPSAALAGADQTLCALSTTLNASVPLIGTGAWLSQGPAVVQNPASAQSTVSGLVAGTNTFIWRVVNGVCAPFNDTAQIWVDLPPNAPSAGASKTICSTSVQLSGSAVPIGTGLWSITSGAGTIDNTSAPNAVVSGLNLGTTVLRWTVGNGVCPLVYDEVSMFRESPPDTAYAGKDQTVDEPVAQLSANTPVNGTGQWQLLSGSGTIDNPGSSSTEIRGLAIGRNVLRWTVSKGNCPANSSDMTIYVESLKIPDGFSPNGDGINDSFVVPGLEYYENVKLQVYNRWGGLVYRNSAYRNDWKGTNMGNEPLADDTYYFTLELSDTVSYSGFVVIKTSK